MGKVAMVATALAVLLGASPAQARTDYAREARTILTPGQAGAFPAVPHSTDQLPLYDGLTPLFDRVGASDVRRLFKPARLGLAGARARAPESTGRPGLRIVRDDRWGVPHVTGRSRADVMFGAGWVTAEDRGLFIETIRGPARVAALDVPGLDALELGTTGRSFTASAQTEAFLSRQVGVLRRLGADGRQVIRDADAYVAGINAQRRATRQTVRPWTRNDVLATTALIGSVFGRGGGDEARSSQLLSALQRRLGSERGRLAWLDLRRAEDPEAPTTVDAPFPYRTRPPGPRPGSRQVDAGSLSRSAERAAAAASAARAPMSNALLVSARRSATGHPLAVMGPQVGYFYPGFLMELDLHGGGIDARGAAFPGVSLYVLLGRGPDFAWSATSSGSDNTDEVLEELCEPGGGAPTRGTTSYRYKGRCRPMGAFDAGVLEGRGLPAERVGFRTTVHGPVTGTATVGGRPYAISRRRSTRGREVASAVGFARLNSTVSSARDFQRAAARIELTFNWFYADDRDIAYYSSGRLPLRSRQADPSLPALGTGRYEWRGYLGAAGHPQAINPPSGVLTSWNNKPAPGFSASDSNYSYGSVHRSQLLRGFGRRNSLPRLVGIMNRAATQDLRALRPWPLIARVLRTGAPDDRTRRAAALVTSWAQRGASRLDRDGDGKVDAPGAAVLDRAYPRLADAVMGPVLGPLTTDLAAILQPDNELAYETGWYGYIDKDLRALLGERVRGRLNRRYCGGGRLDACRRSLWAAVKAAADELAAEQGPDPGGWRADAVAERIRFQPGLLGERFTMRWTNRPTFQQVMEFDGHRRR